MSDDYLWDRSGPPDPEIERLERALAPLRHVPSQSTEAAPVVPITAARRVRPRIGKWVLLAAAAMVAAAAALGYSTLEAPPRPIEARKAAPEQRGVVPAKRAALAVERIEGMPRCGSSELAATGQLGVGEWLETDSGSSARITVAEIGRVDVAGGTRVRLTATGPDQHRLDLERGSISAHVEAPPRLFVVGTPAATAVDLGCAYTLDVDAHGAGSLHVTSGWVSLEDPERTSLVAAGATCRTRPGRGPGTPWFDDASASLRDALASFDFEGGGRESVTAALAAARGRDALSVWHLLARVEAPLRRAVYDKLRALAPPPAGVGEADVLRLDQEALVRWRDDLAGREVPITW